MILVFVQIGGSAEQYTSFGAFGARERAFCQRLSNRFKSMVRAMDAGRVVAEFAPHRVECSEGC